MGEKRGEKGGRRKALGGGREGEVAGGKIRGRVGKGIGRMMEEGGGGS